MLLEEKRDRRIFPRTYNVNGQLASVSWPSCIGGGIQYVYSATQNNGQITQAVDTLSGETISYQYDALKRLTSASSTPNAGSSTAPWTETFQYDGFGNLTAKTLNGTTTPLPANPATNRLTYAGYDANGNITSGAGLSLGYDEANRLLTPYAYSGGAASYTYDPSNRRVVDDNGVFVFYGAKGEKLGTYQYQGNPYCGDPVCFGTFTTLTTSVWFAGRLIVDSSNGIFQDRLGTNRFNGARFYPYGDEITSTSNDRVKFATYTRDSYTGLDYADQRFYASTYGRFNTPDPYRASGRLTDPTRSFNRYAYVLGDPISGFDPRGRDCNNPGSGYPCDGVDDFTDIESGGQTYSSSYCGASISDPTGDTDPGGDCPSDGYQASGTVSQAQSSPQPNCFDGLSGRDISYVATNFGAASDVSAETGGALSGAFILAWGAVESAFGTSSIAQNNNNYFGEADLICGSRGNCTPNANPNHVARWIGAAPCSQVGTATANISFACFEGGFAASAFAAVFSHNGSAISIAQNMPGATPAQLAQAIANAGWCKVGNCVNGGYGTQVQQDYNELAPVIQCLFPWESQ